MKFLAYLSMLVLLVACSDNNEEVSENTSVANVEVLNDVKDSNNGEVDVNEAEEIVEDDNNNNNNDDDAEVTEYPWDIYVDSNEFMSDSEDKDMYRVEDAAHLENKVMDVFQDELDEETAYITTSQWSSFVLIFATQMEDDFSGEYIDKLLELNMTIIEQASESNVSDVIRVTEEAREIRESSES